MGTAPKKFRAGNGATFAQSERSASYGGGFTREALARWPDHR
jgi:hypothetical protein